MRKKFERSAGILLPIFSLPSKYGIGDLGKEAYAFVDFLANSGQSYWQVLPIGPTSFGDSPYQSFSAFAGNPYFVSLDMLAEQELLDRKKLEEYRVQCEKKAVEAREKNMLENGRCGDINYEWLFESRFQILREAYKKSNFDYKDTPEYHRFYRKNDVWVDDYAFFMALKFYFGQKKWQDWPNKAIVRGDQRELVKYRSLLADDIEFFVFVQFQFFEQWAKLKNYANASGIRIIGDMPIYVSTDSADVWAESDAFLTDEENRPVLVAGVPPDYFSNDGQLWGNCLYNWGREEENKFAWWKQRISFEAERFDVIRIDHFIGIVRYWAVPAEDDTARNGSYMDGPGEKLIQAIEEVRGSSRIIAEDLGAVTEQVRTLMHKFSYPGMKVVQFAFDGSIENDHLCRNHLANSVVYTGTHDNDTCEGFLKNADSGTIKNIGKILRTSGKITAQELIGYTLSSNAYVAIIPIQDYLGLGNEARINMPSVLGEGNWCWRLSPNSLTGRLAKKIRRMTEVSERIR